MHPPERKLFSFFPHYFLKTLPAIPIRSLEAGLQAHQDGER